MSKYVNPMYGEHENTQKRRLWLEDKITQMGHHPDKYEQWHQELEALKQAKPVQSVVRPQVVVGRSAGRLKSYGNFKHLTDAELEQLGYEVNKEIKHREAARNQQARAELDAKLEVLKQEGWLDRSKAFGEVRRIIISREMFENIRYNKQLSDSTIQDMVDGKIFPWNVIGPLKSGVFQYGKKKTQAMYEPKQLLCHLMNHCKARDERIKQQKIAEEEKKRKLAEWEELQKARSAQVAKDWYAQMQEANGLWQKAISDLEAKKAARNNVPTADTTQSLPNTDQQKQNG